MAEVSREDGEHSDGSALVLTNACSAPLQNLILVLSWGNSECELLPSVTGFGNRKQDGQRKEQNLNLGGCWRRRAHFWEGKACQKIELGSDGLGKVRVGKKQKWLKLGRTQV